MSMNHCWRAFKAPVSGWACLSRIVHQSSAVPLWYEQRTQTAPRRWSGGLLPWRYASLLGGGHLVALNPILTERLKRLTCSGQGAELSFFFLILSFNRIRLLIISWTSLRPYFNLSRRAGEIREPWLLSQSPGSQQHAALSEEARVFL